MVEVEVNGLQEVLRVRVHPQLLADGDKEPLEDLITAAVNQALQKARHCHADALQDATRRPEMPGFGPEGLAKFMGGTP